MPSTSLRGVAASVSFGLLVTGALVGCSRTVDATYPGGSVVQYPWRACGTDCAKAFSEIQDSHDAKGKDCDSLLSNAEGPGGDPRVEAAALYNSGIILALRNKPAEAAERFARAQAKSPDPDVDRVAGMVRDNAQRYPVTDAPASSPPSSVAPAAGATGSPPAATGAPAAPPPASPAAPSPAPASSGIPAALPSTPGG